jgi:hypothetical protein
MDVSDELCRTATPMPAEAPVTNATRPSKRNNVPLADRSSGPGIWLVTLRL